MWRWVLVVFVLAGCSDVDWVVMDEPAMPGASVDPVEVAERLGCEGLEEQPDDAPVVRELFTCDLDGVPMELYTFNSENPRNAWLDSADTFGYVVVETGPTWALVEASST
jgi:hypothetical protein